MIKAICLDMDDTLIVNQELYTYARAMMEGYLAHFGVTPEDIAPVFAAIEKNNYASMGISIARYPLSFEQTLLHFIPDADAGMIATVRDFAERVFRTVADVKPGVAEALEILARVAPLHIITGGADSVQKFRVDNLPFKEAFNSVTITPSKNAAVYADFAQILGVEPSEILMIGDSLRSDVLPAVQAGLRAVWIEALNAPHELKKAELPEGAYRFTSLLELARHLEKHGSPDHPAAATPPRKAAQAFDRKPRC